MIRGSVCHRNFGMDARRPTGLLSKTLFRSSPYNRKLVCETHRYLPRRNNPYFRKPL